MVLLAILELVNAPHLLQHVSIVQEDTKSYWNPTAITNALIPATVHSLQLQHLISIVSVKCSSNGHCTFRRDGCSNRVAQLTITRPQFRTQGIWNDSTQQSYILSSYLPVSFTPPPPTKKKTMQQPPLVGSISNN
ncbi:hypothetical protein MJO28_016155 [Puccinia striiformis f. sp. tritici]|uniref:Uncharacterized protein n=1 Tax=Puccinia striiformis f. sp. tritici TaxID=168172 RepID=A0ACC0DQR1_9BASI|nr:hypothetical protein MJO28_016155 [Puccinia striiformis f. sp. tritici]KAI9624657.1 hypothetical protein H4Q26_016721 [Puccinia striiformis f. sp. tritici PST-130]